MEQSVKSFELSHRKTAAAAVKKWKQTDRKKSIHRFSVVLQIQHATNREKTHFFAAANKGKATF